MIALVIVVLTFGLAFARSAQGVAADDLIPPWAAGVLGSVVTAYFMTKGAERHAQALTRRQASAPDEQ